MKKYSLLLLACLCTCAAQARIVPGLRLGLAYSQLTQIVDEEVSYGGRIGLEAAGLLDIPLTNRFSLVPELSFANQGGAYNYLYLRDDLIITGRHTCRYYTFSLPVNLVYKIRFADWQLGIQAGPFLSLSTRERERHEWISRDFRTLDVGAGAGLYVEYRAVFFSVYGRTGFIDKLRQKQPFDSQVYQNSVALTFGYRFYDR